MSLAVDSAVVRKGSCHSCNLPMTLNRVECHGLDTRFEIVRP